MDYPGQEFAKIIAWQGLQGINGPKSPSIKDFGMPLPWKPSLKSARMDHATVSRHCQART